MINYRAYAPDAKVETFTMDDYAAAKSKVAQTGKTLMAGLDPQRVVGGEQATLGPGEELNLDLNKGESRSATFRLKSNRRTSASAEIDRSRRHIR